MPQWNRFKIKSPLYMSLFNLSQNLGVDAIGNYFKDTI